MPDPRLPQKGPQPRQPAPQPHKGPPVERSSPGSQKPGDPTIHVTDLESGSQRSTSGGRLVRPLPPDQQAPPVEFERMLRKGKTYWIMGLEEVPKPRKAKIIRLSNEPGKHVGVEFEEPIGGVDREGNPWGINHNCDGNGRAGYCMYVRLDNVLDERAMEIHKARVAEREGARTKYEEYDEMVVSPEHSQPLTPGMPDSLPPPEEEEDEEEDK